MNGWVGRRLRTHRYPFAYAVNRASVAFGDARCFTIKAAFDSGGD